MAMYRCIFSDVSKGKVNALRRASREFNFKNALLITWDLEGRIEKVGVGIEIVPLWKFMVGDSI